MKRRSTDYLKRYISPSVLTYMVSSLVIIGCIGFGITRQHAAASQPSKQLPVDFSFVPYSDSHITQAAIVTDLSLARRMDSTSLTATAANALNHSAPPIATTTHWRQQYGTWIWTPVSMMSPAYMDSILSGISDQGLTTVYLSIDSYLDIYSLPLGTDRDQKIKKFSDSLETFLKKAQIKNIAVYSECGWRNWAEPENTYKPFAIINFVQQFNAHEPVTFAGFQYDIEPYLLDSYKTDPAGTLKHFVTLIDESSNLLGAATSTRTVTFSVVIPDFYDDIRNWTPSFDYAGTTAYTYTHLLRILDKRPASNLVVMAYRNFTLGTDSTIDVSHTELEEAAGHPTRIIIAQETSDVSPSYTTYFNTSRSYYTEQLTLLTSHLTADSAFGGLAVHYADSFLHLK